MRWCVSVGAVLVAGAIVGSDVVVIAAPSPKSRFADTKHKVSSVNVELVIAVDVSYSMDMDELAIQREGYAQAIVSKDFLQALRAGPGSKVAVTYFEWSMSGDEKIVVPWRVIDGPESADAVAAEIMKTPVRRGSSTSISGAINFAVQRFEENPYRGLRRVIDISGDGPNNDGAPVIGARDAALAKGIIINGLPIMVKEPSYSTIDIENLDLYYEDCVIGGPGAFIMTIKDREKFQEAIRTKLVLEVAGLTPERISLLGIGLVPQGRRIFPSLTVRENLVVARQRRIDSARPWTVVVGAELTPPKGQIPPRYAHSRKARMPARRVANPTAMYCQPEVRKM